MARDNTRLKLELRRARVPLTWFLFLLLATVISLYLIFSNLTFERPFENRYKVDVTFDSVKGVFPGTHPVRIAGVQVGVISEVRPEGDDGVATLSIEEEFAPIYKDAEVRIRPTTPLEDVYISIDNRGTPEAGELEPDGEPLPISQSTSQVQISRVLQTFEPEVRNNLAVLLDQMAVGLAGRGETLKQAFAEIAPFLQEAQEVGEVMADREENMRRIVTNFGDLADALAVRDTQLNQLVTKGSDTLQSLASVDSSVSATIAGIPPAMDAIRSSFSSLRAAEDQLDPALRAMLPAASELESGLGALQRFSENATPALLDLQPSVSALRPMAQALQPTSRSLREAMEQLDPQVPRVDGITVTAEECIEEFYLFFQDSLSVLKFGNPLGPFPRSDVSGTNFNVQGLTEGTPNPGLSKIEHCYEGGS